MTSKVSSAGKRKFTPLLHEILWTARRYWWVTALGMLLFLSVTYLNMKISGNDPDEFSLMTRDTVLLPRIAGVIYGIFAAFTMFRFLWSRRECGMTLAVGTVRWKQFILRYTFGFLSVILAVVLPLVFTYYTEMATLVEDYWGVCAHYTRVYTVSLTTLVLLSYTVGVLVSVLCGHLLSTLLTVAGVVAAPYAVLWAVQRMVDHYLFGTPLGDRILSGHLNAGLFTMLADSLQWRRYVRYDIDGNNTTPNWEDYILAVKGEVTLPWVQILLLFLLMMGMAVLACLAYCRRPAEQAGKATVHPVLAHAVALSVGLFAAALVLKVDAPAAVVVALLAVVFILVSSLIRLALTRSMEKFLRHSLVSCVGAVLCVGIILCLATGWFGYSDFIPGVQDVKSVTVTCEQNALLLKRLAEHGGTGGSYGGFMMSSSTAGTSSADRWVSEGDMKLTKVYAYGKNISDNRLPQLTEKADIQTILDIHEAILTEGQQTFTGIPHEDFRKTVVPVDFRITYHLRNGKTVERYYKYITLAMLEKTMEVEDTEAYRSKWASTYIGWNFEDINRIQLGDPLFGDFHTVSLTEEERAILSNALAEDIAATTASDSYFGTDEGGRDSVVGILRMPQDANYVYQCAHPADGYYETIYITSDYEKTLAFLEEKGLTECFAGQYTITDVRTQRYRPRFVVIGENAKTLSQVFFSCDNVIQIEIEPNFSSEDQADQLEHNTNAVPESKWDAYIQNSRAVALMTRPGVMVQIHLTNSRGEKKLVTRYLYDEDAARAVGD